MALIEENIEMLEGRVKKCEIKLDEIMDKLRDVSGYLIAFRGDSNIYHKQVGAYLKNLTNRVYTIKRSLDISLAHKEFRKKWEDEDYFGEEENKW